MKNNFTEEDCKYMKLAIEEAKKSEREREVPVGAVIIKNNKILSTGRNKRELSRNALFHAEIEAIYNACKVLNSWRLTDCSIYVTLEPCAMCAGAIINSRISKVFYGASDSKSGSCNSLINLFELPYNHKPDIISGVLEYECSCLLSDFFKKLRQHKTEITQKI